MEVDLGKYRKFVEGAWMEQHMDIYKKWLNRAVFATLSEIKLTSKGQTKNSYFRNLQSEKFCGIVVSVLRARQSSQVLRDK